MKKMLALVLAMMMCLSCAAAMGEGLQTAEITVEALPGTTMSFEDLGISLTIPEVLAQTEVTEENAAAGVFDCYALADGSAYIMLGANQLESDDALNNLVATLQADGSYSEIGILVINGIAWLTYTQAETNLLMFSTNVGEILLTAYCSPANDEGFQSTLLCTLGSLAAIAE